MNDYKNRLTPELVDAMDIVCSACPYISEACDNEEIVDAAYVGRYEDSGAKYCERCMVRHMYNSILTLILVSGELSSTTDCVEIVNCQIVII